MLPQPPVLTLHVKPADDGDGVIVRLLNASDQPQRATVGSAIMQIVSAAACDLFGVPQVDLIVSDGQVMVELQPRQVQVLKLEMQTSTNR